MSTWSRMVGRGSVVGVASSSSSSGLGLRGRLRDTASGSFSCFSGSSSSILSGASLPCLASSLRTSDDRVAAGCDDDTVSEAVDDVCSAFGLTDDVSGPFDAELRGVVCSATRRGLPGSCEGFGRSWVLEPCAGSTSPVLGLGELAFDAFSPPVSPVSCSADGSGVSMDGVGAVSPNGSSLTRVGSESIAGCSPGILPCGSSDSGRLGSLRGAGRLAGARVRLLSVCGPLTWVGGLSSMGNRPAEGSEDPVRGIEGFMFMSCSGSMTARHCMTQDGRKHEI